MNRQRIARRKLYTRFLMVFEYFRMGLNGKDPAWCDGCRSWSLVVQGSGLRTRAVVHFLFCMCYGIWLSERQRFAL